MEDNKNTNNDTGPKHFKNINTKTNLFQKETQKTEDFLLDHSVLKSILTVIWHVFILFLSAFAFAYGYRAFIAPSAEVLSDGSLNQIPALISGGASGIALIFIRICELLKVTDASQEATLQSVFYLIINIPLFFIAWKYIGKKFTFTTIIDVVMTSVFVKIIPESWAIIFAINTDFIARALFAGVLTGVSSGLAYLIGSSAGGMDIVAFSLANHKSTNVGKYSLIISTFIILIYSVINCVRLNSLSEIPMALYTIIYFFTASKITDLINIKNKKTELQITTDVLEMGQLLVRAFPHGCTVIDAVGAYTGRPRKVIYMVVSASEVKQVVTFVRKIDINSFVNVTNSSQVYGKFYIKPIK
jgi:uncharacterized membrane-anchored protein YitT (DUF2179 family)